MQTLEESEVGENGVGELSWPVREWKVPPVKWGWVGEEEMSNSVVVCSSTPGYIVCDYLMGSGISFIHLSRLAATMKISWSNKFWYPETDSHFCIAYMTIFDMVL